MRHHLQSCCCLRQVPKAIDDAISRHSESGSVIAYRDIIYKNFEKRNDIFGKVVVFTASTCKVS